MGCYLFSSPGNINGNTKCKLPKRQIAV